jgi:hypothetical protein
MINKLNMKKIVFSIILILCSSFIQNNLFAQTIEAKYLRPSMTILYLNDDDRNRQDLIDAIAKSSETMKSGVASDKFDKLSIGMDRISLLNFPKRPTPPPTSLKKQDPTRYFLAQIEYSRKIKQFNSKIQILLTDRVQNLAKEVIKKTFIIDSYGNMSDELIRQRGLYSATDGDVIKDNASQISRIADLGYDLLQRSFIVVYQLDDYVKIDKQYYDEIDKQLKAVHDTLVKKGLSSGDFKPTMRLDEGYKLMFNAYTFKLEITKDWLMDEFFKLYWIDKTTSASDRANRLRALENLVVPTKFLRNDRGNYSALASYGSNEPMDKLFANSSKEIQELSFFKSSNKINDLAAKATVFESYPITAKIGTKEDVYVDQRYFVYETTKKKESSDMVSRRIGVIRAMSPISNNSDNANGNSLTTKFRQVSGKKVYPGMSIIQKDSKNVNFSLDYFKNNIGNGFGFSYELNLFSGRPGFGVGSIKSTKGPTGVYTGLDVVILPDWFLVTLSTGKEIYLLPTGNLFLYPKIGVGYKMFNPNSYTSGLDDGIAINPSLGLGLNLSPWFTLMAKYNYFNIPKYTHYEPTSNPNNLTGTVVNNTIISIGGKVRF